MGPLSRFGFYPCRARPRRPSVPRKLLPHNSDSPETFLSRQGECRRGGSNSLGPIAGPSHRPGEIATRAAAYSGRGGLPVHPVKSIQGIVCCRTMTEPIVLDPSGEPSPPTPQTQRNRTLKHVLKSVKLFLGERILELLALLVIAGQLLVMHRQTTIADKQTVIAQRQFDLADVQQRSATRPNVGLLTGGGMQQTPWTFTNKGPYKIVDISMRNIHFKKFPKSGWQVFSSSTGLMEEVLEAGKSIDIPFAAWLEAQEKVVMLTDEIPIQGTDIIIMEIHFRKESDEKEYIFVQPVVLLENSSWIVTPSKSTTAGPLKLACNYEAYSMELMYEHYRRNPVQFPTEIYNFHYLLGNDPGTTCLNSSQRTSYP